MARHGIVSIYNNPDGGEVPGAAFYAKLAALSPAPNHLSPIRGSISVDRNNHVDIGSLKRSFQGHKDADFEPWPVLHGGLEQHYQTLTGADYLAAMPNAALGLGGDMLINDYINRYSLTCVGTLLALGELCPSTVWLWNEPNLDPPGLRPGVAPVKRTSLAPEVFGALLATTAKRIRASCPLVRTILIGSLSCLVKFNTNPEGDYVAGYLDRALSYIARYGVDPPYDFEGISLNPEGVITEAYSEWCASAVTRVMRKFGIGGQGIVSEAGLPNGTIARDHLDMTGSFAALDDHWGILIWYCFPTEVPMGDPSVYGMEYYTYQAGLIVPTGETPMYAAFAGYQAARTPQP